MPSSALTPLSPGALRALDPRLLCDFLTPFRDFLAAHGLEVAVESIDCGALFALVSRTDVPTPAALADGLHHVRGLATSDHMAALLAACARDGLTLDLPADATPAEIALRVWMLRPDLIERRAAENEIDGASTLTLFAATQARPLPFTSLDALRLAELATRLAPWFEARRRGRRCEVFAVERTEGIWFVVARGDAVRCTPTRRLDDDRPDVVRYRPERHDLILYRPTTGEFGVRAQGLRLIDHYRATFGAFLFGDEAHFQTQAKFDLSPLAIAGRAALACEDFAGEIECIRLVGITLQSEFAPATRTTHEGKDVFAYFERRRKTLRPASILSATLRVKFTASARPRTFSIRSASKVRQARDADAFLLESWMRARGFIPTHSIAAQAAA